MIIVIASRYDEIAIEFVARWQVLDIDLLTCEDLSLRGWRYSPGISQSSAAVVGGRAIALAEITGILMRLTCVSEEELLHIVPADRTYVAAEMTAFLLAWLSELPCPVLNRPTSTSLSGPNWRPEQWTHTAAGIGIPVRPIQRTITRTMGLVLEAPAPPPITVTVVGEHCFGSVDKALTVSARRLADAAHVDLLAVQFSGPEPGSFFVGAHIWPDITADDVANAVIEYLQKRYVG